MVTCVISWIKYCMNT